MNQIFNKIPTKILLLSTHDSYEGGGAAKATYTLYKNLLRLGVSHRMLVRKKTGDDLTVESPAPKIPKIVNLIRSKFDSIPKLLYKNKGCYHFNISSYSNVVKTIKRINPAVVHLNSIYGGFPSIEDLSKIRNPIIWTLHDMWPFTGGCLHSGTCLRYQRKCGNCPQLCPNNDNDLSRKIWRKKQKYWKGLDLTIVAVSKWLAQCAKNSSLFKNKRIETIPNCIDISVFKPIDKKVARYILNLPQDKKLILFGAINPLKNHNKGFHFLQSALEILSKKNWKEKAELVIFGTSKPQNSPNIKLKTHYLGRINDETILAIIYSAADVMIVPSIQEAFGLTAAESLSCGTPVVSFGATGLLDIIDHQKNGYLAKPFDVDNLAQGILWILEDSERWQTLSEDARKKIKKNFNVTIVSQKYLNLYKEIINQN